MEKLLKYQNDKRLLSSTADEDGAMAVLSDVTESEADSSDDEAIYTGSSV